MTTPENPDRPLYVYELKELALRAETQEAKAIYEVGAAIVDAVEGLGNDLSILENAINRLQR